MWAVDGTDSRNNQSKGLKNKIKQQSKHQYKDEANIERTIRPI